MSLINEALRKARQEAEEQKAEEKASGRRGGPSSYRRPKAHLPEPSKLGTGVAMGLALGLFLALVGGFAVWWMLGNQAATPATESTVPAAVVAEKPAAPSTPEGQPTPVAAPAVTPTEAPASPAENRSTASATTPAPAVEAPASSDPQPAVAEPVEPAPAVPQPDTPQPAAPQPAAPQPAAPQPESTPNSFIEESIAEEPVLDGPNELESAEDPDLPKLIQPPESVGRVGETNVFVLEADLGDTTLTLDFIVWNPNAPFAQINGKQVEVGQLVSGLLVERIERDRVTLKAADGRIVLRVR